MKTLPETFTYDGFAFRLLKRMGDVALFEKRKPTHSRESFEVVIVQKLPAKTILGCNYPAREAMPRSEAWGKWGWTCTGLEDAVRKFQSLVEARHKGHSLSPPFPVGAFSSGDGIRTEETRLWRCRRRPPRNTASIASARR